MSNLIENLKWRYATKKFDSSKSISENDLETLKEAIRLSASSYGLQLYEVLIIKNKEVRDKLLPAAYNQSQITDASCLFLFCSRNDVVEKDIDNYFNNLTETRGITLEDVKGYSDYMKGAVLGLPVEAKQTWTAKQCYIALGNLLAAAAELKIDACPMEGFDSSEFNKILNLTEKGLNATVLAAVGYRSEEDQTRHYAKVRKSKKELFTTI
ncbi:NAD(P)H-dependent oxidoreductase [Abyssalbus ytuae]|uniref:NAD(P)H-dependent oxidoreductase n=1 Tax=Abyssalbus ytuae TaxID=2926907 RepID=A0A9E6ZLJ8_9FLAO|nr:NAD(P)H-dependent oxidoreductase [Abyssalbus ytuae]UOB16849.1 NAD(P)H-dependent oxidoreductase [Abyssalbus ytuae]